MNRPRTIVALAASKVTYPMVQTWLAEDFRGTWEKVAEMMLEASAPRAAELGMSPEKVNEAVAVELALRALDVAVKGGYHNATPQA